jgi:hypothetical protein
MIKYIALKDEQIARLKPRGFHQKIEAKMGPYSLVEDVSFFLFCALDLRPGEVSIKDPLPEQYLGRYPCLTIALNF